jgi:glycosyltransferase involved in cell wall biosynthesis
LLGRRDRDSDVHVLHVVRTLIVEGGMERAMRRVVEGLARRGIRHSVLLLSDAEDILDFGGAAPVYRVVSPPRDPRMPLGIWQQLEKLAPTVIHVRNWGPWPDTTLARVFRWPRTPLVWSFHGVESLGGLPAARRIAFRFAGAMTTRMFAVSEAAKRLLVKLVGIPARRVEVIVNGVDTARYVPRDRHARDAQPNASRFVIGTVGRLEPIKNQALLVDACAELCRRGHDIELAIAGTGSMEPELRALTKRHAIEDRVRFVGHVEDVPRFLAGLDAFALTSDSEGNPNALLEAMSCALPSVCTAVGGVEEVLDTGRAGLLVPAGGLLAVADALERLILSTDLRTALGARARERMSGAYSLERMLDAYEALYRRPRRPR